MGSVWLLEGKNFLSFCVEGLQWRYEVLFVDVDLFEGCVQVFGIMYGYYYDDDGKKCWEIKIEVEVSDSFDVYDEF